MREDGGCMIRGFVLLICFLFRFVLLSRSSRELSYLFPGRGGGILAS